MDSQCMSQQHEQSHYKNPSSRCLAEGTPCVHTGHLLCKGWVDLAVVDFLVLLLLLRTPYLLLETKTQG